MHRNIYMSWIGTGVLGMFEQRRNGITGLWKFTAAFSHVLWCAYVRKSPLDEPKTVKRFGKHNMSESFSIICICTPSRTVSRRTSSSNTAIELFCKCIRIELRRHKGREYAPARLYKKTTMHDANFGTARRERKEARAR
jgi:hypothetical protein